MKKWTTLLVGCAITLHLTAQETFPVNGVADKREGCYAFTHATIVKDGQTTLQDATLIIRKGKIISAGSGAAIPKDAVVIDCKGKFIYPSFIDIYSDYGVGTPQRDRGAGFDFRAPAQLTSNQKGAYGWNQALRTDVEAAKIFAVDNTKAKSLREAGFGTVLSHQKDGIARGTGVVATLAEEKENLVIVKEKASAHYSLNKGISTQSYPSSMMGSIALLRQTYLDAQWYKNNPTAEGVNLSLKYWNEQQSLPQIFDAGGKWNDVRADRIGDEFGVQYIIKGGGDEYQRLKEIKATNAAFILPLNFPQAMDVEDPNDARFVSLEDMKHWEMAPAEAGLFEKENITFCLTSADLKDSKQFLTNLRKAIEYGLTENRALEALTKTPATLLGVYDKVGSLDAGKLANFIITSGPVFKENTTLFQNWVQGNEYDVKNEGWNTLTGTYTVTVTSAAGTQKTYNLLVKSENAASIIAADTITARFSFDGKLVKLGFSETKRSRTGIRLSGVSNGTTWQGNGTDTAGNSVLWTASFVKAAEEKSDSAKRKPPVRLGAITYPFDGYGWEQLPRQQTLLIKNATVWTNEKEGKLEGADVLVKNGKITQVGKNLSDAGATVIDGTGKHLTAGIIDEHSHIATSSINEGAQSVTSEVRIADNLNPDDINIYRQLSGGVTSSHILHGSANTVGGQTQLIKLRWGFNDDELKFKGADPFIKFALGENVKRTTSQNNNRFPDTRMGVEQVLVDAFQRATDYQNALKGADGKNVRRDLELEALSEILNKKRFITCHSYVASEITSTIRVAEKFGFTLNTFTHILEGYKVADKMKAHGSNASTFSDWWAYKMEVQDAMAYNAAIMQKMGLNVCINSDDAEMARRLNQEAAKTVKYGGVSEEEALKMVTLNPAKALHVSDKVGSIKVGKDADLVLWSNHPLSIYAMAEKTIVDGTIFFDREKDAQMRVAIAAERNRLINKMLGEKKSGAAMAPARPSFNIILSCGDHDHHDGLITIDAGDDE
ncbi:Imidazolonepropionase [Filimonas lacunae]|uniref:Imidazolonepropionase n=1 Tax=Filimonas lacunae TaxID=477680 RepID=A0A173MQ37_9BACT|nr:amidohydrolase family protein [Filimonas lacunae]BAV09607.1 secreted enzyme, contains two amidohydrolase related domains [Filimonas lacunae]SIS75851.1 Imidazolonepropionase [Filimonas lacunae]